MSGFKTTCYGKWILFGEHTVLRGGPALVFPLKSRSLVLEFEARDRGGLRLDLDEKLLENQSALFWAVLERGMNLLKIPEDRFHGIFHFSNSIPIGSGLGASAAFCVSIARFFCHYQYIKEEEIIEFSRVLENLFHGESSGVDVTVVHKEKPLLFYRERAPQFLQIYNHPWVYLSYCGRSGHTRDCVSKVKEFISQDETLGKAVDERMISATKVAMSVLLDANMSAREMDKKLNSPFEMGYSCFKDWGLLTPELVSHIDILKSQGALSAKPTGSGGGGFVLSLWTDQPSAKIIEKLDLMPGFLE